MKARVILHLSIPEQFQDDNGVKIDKLKDVVEKTQNGSKDKKALRTLGSGLGDQFLKR